MIFKVLAIAAVLFLVYMIFFKKSRVQNKKESDQEQITDTLVECPKCGTYVSKDEAILSNGKYYCSKECLSQ